MRRLLPSLVASVLATTAAQARPQYSASSQLGVVAVGGEGRLWRETRVDLGVRLEALYGRSAPHDGAFGPYLEARTAWFEHADYGGGLMALVPVHPTFPVWFGAGAFGRRQQSSWSPGAHAFLAWGGRDFNYEGDYAMAFGLLLDARVHRGEFPGVDIILAVSIDLEGLAIPFIYGVSRVLH